MTWKTSQVPHRLLLIPENQQFIMKSIIPGKILDTNRIILKDEKHSHTEERYFCIGVLQNGIVTVRFTMRKNKIRIFGAGYWREGKKLYEKRYQIQ